MKNRATNDQAPFLPQYLFSTQAEAEVRIRITQPLSGSIDGIQLSRFVVGLTYDIGTTLGNYLLATGSAIPVEETTPALVLPFHDVAEILFPRSNAADIERNPRRRPPKR